VVSNAKATVLVGVTARPKLFNEEILGILAKNTERPVIFALSNPTSRSECSILDVAQATGGRGLVAVGSPFPPAQYDGKTLVSSQCNNLYIFPGVGLGALVAKSLRVTTGMFLAASKCISGMVTPEQEDRGLLLPEMTQVREVSARVATAVAIEARKAGLGRLLDDATLEALVRKAQWYPSYPPYRPGPPMAGFAHYRV
jgi:malic enzyme